MAGRPANADRQNAIALGLPTYIGAVHSKCGTNVRYTNGGGCMHCAREIAERQREALKIVMQQALDNKPEVEVETTDDGEARRAQDIEDMM